MPGLAATTDLLHLFGDPTRVRLLALLARHELTVAELTGILEVGQSRVSTHLGRLREAGLLRDRRNGASTVYALNGAMPQDARGLWTLLERQIDDTVLASDARRCGELLRARDSGAEWPDAVAGQMERHYSPGRTWEATARAFLGLMAPLMLRPSGQIARTYDIPRAVMREAYGRNPVHRAKMREALGKVRDLCVELGLVTPVSRRLWQVLGLWDPVRAPVTA